MDLRNKTFLLCLGTQKAGTSWLWDFLKDIPNIDFGSLKEYHVFDRLLFQEFIREDLKILDSVAADKQKILSNRNLWKRLLMISNTQEYFNYFCNILNSQTKNLTGDFTPEYSLLDVDKLRYIKEEFENRNIKTKVIFLMREPVERIWSADRMTMRETNRIIPLVGSHNSKFVEMFTRYETIIPKIESVFDEENIYYNFYENLFTDDTIKEILSFLDIPFVKADFSKRVNSSKYQEIGKIQREFVQEYYSETYSFVKSKFTKNYPW